jgi:hypothetical protein
MPSFDLDLEPTVAACDVCVALEGDHRLKPDVVWCETCQAYLCPTCRYNAWRRFQAAWKRRLRRVLL